MAKNKEGKVTTKDLKKLFKEIAQEKNKSTETVNDSLPKNKHNEQ